jgi:hypothetical protein
MTGKQVYKLDYITTNILSINLEFQQKFYYKLRNYIVLIDPNIFEFVS